MESYRTEEEQVEAIKKWWRENGKSTVFGIVAAVLLVVGWKSWQGYQRDMTAQASAVYDQLLVADAAGQQNGGSYSSAEQLADTLKQQFSNTAYADFASLFKAKYAALNEDYSLATDELQQLLKDKPAPAIETQALLRLATLKYAQEDYAEAQKHLAEIDAVAYQTAVAELRGDIFYAQGDKLAALTAYQEARQFAGAQQQAIDTALLDMKISELAPLQAQPEGER